MLSIVTVLMVMVADVIIPPLPAAIMTLPHDAIAFQVTHFAAAFGDDAAAGKASADAHDDDAAAAAAAAQTKKSKSKQDSVTLKASPARSAAAARKRFARSYNSFRVGDCVAAKFAIAIFNVFAVCVFNFVLRVTCAPQDYFRAKLLAGATGV